MKMAVPLCKSAVPEVYQEVMDDVINNVQALFVEEGVDEEVLEKLKQTWKTKFLETYVVESETESNLPKVELQSETVHTMLPCKLGSEGGTKVVLADNRISEVPNGSDMPQNDNAASGSSSFSTSFKPIEKSYQKMKKILEKYDLKSHHQDDLEEFVDDVPDSDKDVMSEDEKEPPLGSDDDQSIPDEETTSENIIYCKCVGILNTSNNIWIFFFDHGIMKLDGQEYVFESATGTAQF